MKRKLHEFPVSEDALLPVCTSIGVRHFVPGQYLDVTGIIRGKGFQGVMKKNDFVGGPASHGASKSHRSGGSTGQRDNTGRALVDAPDMVRCQMKFKRLSLTDLKVDIPRVPKKKVLVQVMETADVKNKWENNSWGRKLIVKKRRDALNEFDRFKIMLAKIKFV